MIEARRFVLFGGDDHSLSGGMGDFVHEGPTLVEVVKFAVDRWGQPLEMEGGESVRLQWAHIWDVVEDRIVEVPATAQAREILLETLEAKGKV